MERIDEQHKDPNYNPWSMHSEGYGSHCVCLRVYVCLFVHSRSSEGIAQFSAIPPKYERVVYCHTLISFIIHVLWLLEY